MADLYTTLVRAKQELNGGVLPAMTPVPENVQHFIDPAFVPGMGALQEDVDKGLRCPVRNCGKYFHALKKHLDVQHADIGGERSIKRALSIPVGATLLSTPSRAKFAALARDLIDAGKFYRGNFDSIRRYQAAHPEKVRANARLAGREEATVGSRNLRNTCEAQLAQRLLAIAQKLGRTPSANEAREMDSQSLVVIAQKLYGSWNAFVATVGLQTNRQGCPLIVTREQAVVALREWYHAHGSLPSSHQINKANRLPLIPGRDAIMAAMETRSWPEAMERAAALIPVYGGRYGLPEKARPKKEQVAA